MLIVITGATAVGKTELGIKLAKELNGEVLNADSMMIYKYMDVGTAKPTPEEMEGVPHHLMDLVLPSENFSVKDYVEAFDRSVESVAHRGKIPILVGGSWLYIQSALYGIAEAPEGNWKIREEFYKRENQDLYSELLKVDPEYGRKVHLNDKRRIVRALEVYHLTGKPFSTFLRNHNYKKARYRFIGFVIERDKEDLMRRIELRVEKMFKKGLVREVEELIEMGLKDSLTAMQAIGYKELIPYIESRTTLEDAKSSIIKNTKNFAKRQVRTFKNRTEFKPLKLEEKDINLTLAKLIKELGADGSLRRS
ncbi:MAG: tRNA (adenosine(37)-N6)-dimethylallyltransferase MiaA [Hydrogenothermaceae bacterium]|nr:tRNA (adenosine(37)-N6)-dimethylallyltransferase MiaA [Hydrogenothermaceae bacterium]